MTWGKTLVLSLAVVVGFVALGLLQRFPPQPGPESRLGEPAAKHGERERYQIVSIRPPSRRLEPPTHAELTVLDTATGYTFFTTVKVSERDLSQWMAYDEK